MENKVTLKASKQEMKKFLTCLLCKKLYDRATTITECLHTFCRKCVEDKFIEENLKACPECNIDLGVFPLDKLRMDIRWQELREIIFKPKPKNVKPATKTNATSLKYSRKKKKAVSSSLLATSSRESTLLESNPDAPLEPDKLAEQMEAVPLIQSSSRPISMFRKRPRKNPKPKRNETSLKPQQPHKEGENGFKIPLNFEQNNGSAGASTYKGCMQKEDNLEKGNEETPVSSYDLSQSLSSDKEVAPPKSKDTVLILDPEITLNGKDNQDYVCGEKSEECENTVLNRPEGETADVPVDLNAVFVSSDCVTEEVSGENNGQENVPTSGRLSVEKKKEKDYSPPVLRPRKQRKMNSDGTSQAAISMEPESKVEGSDNPVWFSLKAAANQKTDRPLPQISPLYLRVTNGNLPVSYVKKYLVKKLNLESEDEVEIWLRQEPVCSTQQRLQNLVDWWVQTTPIAERKSAAVGSSGAEFVLVLYYSRSHLFA